jgi:hypothetical protein
MFSFVGNRESILSIEKEEHCEDKNLLEKDQEHSSFIFDGDV